MRERGLYQFMGLLFIALLLIAGAAWLTGGDRRAQAAQTALRDEPVPARGPAAERAGGDPQAAVCVADGAPRAMDEEIRESSGVAVSRAHAGIFWTHNDSGDPLLFAVDAQGRTAGRVRVAGARVEDWEDLAIAPCPAGGDCLYVADIGDNDAARAFVTVYRIPEPQPGAAHSAQAEALRLRYPDGAHDAEAMFVLNGAVHLVTKGESGTIALYRAPVGAGAEAVLERVRELSSGKVDRALRITGADASVDGRWVALRTLQAAAFYRSAELLSAREASPLHLDLSGLDERQGEGIGFAADGSLLLSSEGSKKEPGTFTRLSCTLP